MKTLPSQNTFSLSVQEAADKLGVNSETLRRWERIGKLIPERTIGNQRRYSIEQLRDFKKQRALLRRQKRDLSAEAPAEWMLPKKEPHTSLAQPERNVTVQQLDNAPLYSSNHQTISNNTEIEQKNSFFSRARANKRSIYTQAAATGFLTLFILGLLSLLPLGNLPLFESFQTKPTLQGGNLSGGDVLAGEAADFKLSVNIPAIFNSSVNLKKGLEVTGIATLSGGLITNNQNGDFGTGIVIASNIPTVIITGVSAGSGISVSDANPAIPEITNTGVLSLQGSTGAVTLSQGTGISISGLTITNNGVTSIQGETGSVTFTGGTGISVSGTTITNSLPSQWTTNGTNIGYTTGNVGIGTTDPTQLFDVSGGTGIVGQFSGRVIGGDAVNANEFATLGQISGGAGQYWQRNLGALSPTNITDDVLIGGIASGSAPISFSSNGLITLTDVTLSRGAADRLDLAAGDRFNLLSGALEVGNTAVITATRLIQSADGSESAPSLSFASDINTGLFTGGDILGFTTNATEKMRIDSAGNLGINTTTPTSFKLEIAGNIGPDSNGTRDIGSASRVWNAIYVNNIFPAGTGIQGYWQRSGQAIAPTNITDDVLLGGNATASALIRLAGTTGTSSFFTGNVGIGTTNPLQKLHVIRDDATTDSLVAIGRFSHTTTGTAANGIGGVLQINLENAAGTEIGATDFGGILTDVTNGSEKGAFIVRTSTNNVLSEKFRIDNNGNVGIGTTAPIALLDVNGNASISGNLTFNATNAIITNTAKRNLTIGGTGTGGIFFPSFATCTLQTDSNGKLTCGSGGGGGGSSGGINTIQEGGSTVVANALIIDFDDTDFNVTEPIASKGAVAIDYTNSRITRSNQAETITGGWTFNTLATSFLSNVGIGTTSPITKLHVTGATTGKALVILNETGNQDIFTASASGTTRFTIANNGTLTASAYGAGVAQFNSSGVLSSSALNLAGGASLISGVLPIANGGTNSSATPTAGGVAYGTGTAYAFTTAGNTGQCLVSNGASTPGWSDCSAAAGDDWITSNGALYPINATVDLLIGGTATSSAKFAFMNVNSGSPTASIAGNLAIAVPTGANPATTYTAFNGGTVNVRTSAGGDSGATSRLYIANNGNIGIGTTAPAALLNVNGNITASSLRFEVDDASEDIISALNDGLVLEWERTDANDSFTAFRGETTNGTREFMRLEAGNLGIGTSNPISALHVTRLNSFGATGKALALFNQTESQDIFTASASGTTRFTIANNGTLTASAYSTGVAQFNSSGVLSSSALNLAGGTSLVTGVLPIANGGTNTNTLGSAGSVAYSNGTAYAFTSVGSSGQILTSGGSGTPTWVDPNTQTFGLWDQALGALRPKNSTVDLLVGGTSTASAKFAFINVNSGSPTATIAGNLALAVPTGTNPATTYTAFNGGTINLRTSVGGDGGATSRLFVANNGNIGMGTTTPASVLHIAAAPTQPVAVGDEPSLYVTSYAAGAGSQGALGSLWFGGGEAGLADVNNEAAGIIGYSPTDYSGTSREGELHFYTTAVNTLTSTEKMRLSSAGNLGIGTTAPTSFMLQAAGNIGPDADNTYDLGASSSARFRDLYLGPSSFHFQCLTTDGCGQNIDWGMTIATGGPGRNSLQIGPNRLAINSTAPAFSIIESGNVGIGTASAQAAFHVVRPSGNSVAITARNFAANDDTNIQICEISVACGYFGMDGTTNNLYLGATATDSTTNLTVASGGNVGIGSTGPEAKLHVSGTTGTTIQLTGGSSSGAPTIYLDDEEAGGTGFQITNGHDGDGKLAIRDVGGNSTLMTITNAGNVGIGNTTPENKLVVSTSTATDAIVLAGSSNNVGLYTNLGNGSINPLTVSGDRGIFYSGSGVNNPGGGFLIAPWRSNTTGFRLDEGAAAIISGGAANGKPALTLDQVGSSSNDIFAASASGTTRFVIRNDGNVGIGTHLPLDDLDVTGSLRVHSGSFGTNGFVFEQNSNGDMPISYKNPTSVFSSPLTIGFNGTVGIGTTAIGAAELNVDYTSAAGADIFIASKSGTTQFKINNRGNVGIGTTAPISKFHLSESRPVATGTTIGSRFLSSITGTVTAPSTNSYGLSTNFGVGSLDGQYSHFAAGFLSTTTLDSNSTIDILYGMYSILSMDSSRITTNGNTATTAAALTSIYFNQGSTVTNGYGALIDADNAQGTTTNLYGIYVTSGKQSGTVTNSTAGYFSASGGTTNLGILVETSSVKIQNNGSDTGNFWDDFQAATGATHTCISGAGVFGTCTSDARLKENIQYLPMNEGLAAVRRLKPAKFDFINDHGDKNELGFIAQDVLEVVPDAIKVGDDGYYTFTNDKLVPHLTLAIQELDQKLSDLQMQIDPQGDVQSEDPNNPEFASLVVEELSGGKITTEDMDITGSLTYKGKSIEEFLSETVGSITGSVSGGGSGSGMTATESAQINTQFADMGDTIGSLTNRVSSVEQLAAQTASDAAFLKSIVEGGQVLGASDSAFLGDLDNVEVGNLTVSDDLSILGRTTLSDVGITGTLTAGVLSINGIDGELNTVGEPLKIQSLAAENVDFMAGKVIIETNGDVKTKGTVTATKFAVDDTDSDARSLGSGTINSGEDNTIIYTSAVTNKSKIFVTATSPTGKQSLIVSEKDTGESFKVELEESYTDDITFDWWIVN